ncbi:GntR family transcriptional regulator [Paraburkholderia sp. J41]|uniref:GntR family transcriptional regulator n=1 Tax=Paraburkholderia sp. J41 TaxID=2805433 RepID=UPI002AC351DE|nr:FCD domain-containing protein [Paraburkholderia sp. J41]
MSKPRPELSVEKASRTSRSLGPTGPANIQPKVTQADKATQMIFDDILRDRLKPGERLTPEALSERYSLGLSPVREALIRLSVEKLVQGGGYRGFEVPEISIDELMDIANVRAELSCLALRESMRRGDERWEAGIIAAYHMIDRIPEALRARPQDYANAWEERNWVFHDALEGASGSPWLNHFISLLAVHSKRYRSRFFDYQKDALLAQQEHRALMDAVLTRDADRACQLMTEHVLGRVRTFRKLMQRSE